MQDMKARQSRRSGPIRKMWPANHSLRCDCSYQVKERVGSCICEVLSCDMGYQTTTVKPVYFLPDGFDKRPCFAPVCEAGAHSCSVHAYLHTDGQAMVCLYVMQRVEQIMCDYHYEFEHTCPECQRDFPSKRCLAIHIGRWCDGKKTIRSRKVSLADKRVQYHKRKELEINSLM